MINKHDAPKGYIAVKGSKRECKGCDLYTSKCPCLDLVDVCCSGRIRKDKSDVFFKKAPVASRRRRTT